MFASKDALFAKSSGSYQISRSLRFRSSASAYLSRTCTTSNRRTFTWSGWVKSGTSAGNVTIFGAGVAGTEGGAHLLSGVLEVYNYSGGGYNIQLVTSQVFRDPSAWYHLVVAFDTTQATASNRVKIYVNGTQITSFSTANYGSQNFDTQINYASSTQYVGAIGGGNTMDGYLAEVNFIDGQALTPSSFGAFDTNGVWQPAKYTGSYGTNGFYLPFTLNSTSSYAGSFNGSSKYLTTPTSSNLAFGTGDFTIEGWFNQTTLNNCGLVCQDYATGVDIRFNEGGSNVFGFYINNSSFVSGSYASSNTGQWHHFALVRNGSGSNNVKLYLDGVVLCQTTSTANLTSNQFRIGANLTGGTTPAGTYFSGSISNVRVVKGTAVYTAAFTPSSAALTAITNTQLLTLQDATIVDNSSNAFTLTNTGTVATATATPFVANITSDASGQNNGWLSNNINYTSSGTTYDSMIDSPTNYADGGNGRGNYCVLNPLDKNSSATLTEANLSNYASSAAWQGARATFGINTGKWYIEGDITNHGTAYAIGFANSLWTLGQTAGDANASGIYWDGSSTSYYWFTTTVTNAGFTPANGNTFVMAIDMDAGKVWLGYRTTSTTWLGGGNPATGTTPTFTFTPNITLYPCISTYNTTQRISINFGQRPYTGTMPSGFSALNTQNLPTPTIANGAQYMAASLWTGTGSATTIPLGSFTPDLVWWKSRSNAEDHHLIDTVRGKNGGTYYASLSSNLTAAEDNTSSGDIVTNISSSGLTVDNLNGTPNVSGRTYVGWQWKAGGTGVSNTSGSITSTVSANTSAGFSVVAYTGNSAANQTVGHGLGVTPALIIVKCRSQAATNWVVWNSTQPSLTDNLLQLNTTASYSSIGTIAQYWGSSAPNSTVFGVKSGGYDNNQNGQTHVAYCFAPVAGYSAFGSYTGNGSADGPMIFTGFRPRWVMIKQSSGVESWHIQDTSRATYNEMNAALYPNLSNSEGGSPDATDFLSNGFKIRNTWTGANTSGATYIWAAFAENPFKYSRAR